MRWLNGPSVAERVDRWKKEMRIQCSWHKWFAWYPVKVGEENDRAVKVWFSYVERKRVVIENPQNYDELQVDYWEYRELKR